MHVLMVTPFAPPERGASIIRVESFRSALEEKGHTVTIASPAREGVPHAKGVVRYRGVVGLFNVLLTTPSVDVVVGTSPPSPPNFWVVLGCRLRGIPFVLDSKDPFIEYAEAEGSLKEGTLKHFLSTTMDRIAHAGADSITTLTKEDVGRIQNRYGIPSSRISLIPNGIDPNVLYFDAEGRKRVRKQMGILPRDKVIVYAGSLGDERFHELLDRLPSDFAPRYHVHFLVVASVITPADREWTTRIRSSASAKGWEDRLHMVENIPYPQMKDYLSAGDAGWVPVPMHWTHCLPVKALDYAGCGLPIIGMGPTPSPFSRFLQESDAGRMGSSWNAVIRAWEESFSSFAPFRARGKKGMKYVRSQFLRKKSSQEMVRLLERIRRA